MRWSMRQPVLMPLPPPPMLQSSANPQSAGGWAAEEGQHFPDDHSSPDIDVLAFHLWVNNW